MRTKYTATCVKEFTSGGPTEIVVRNCFGVEVERKTYDFPVHVVPVGKTGYFSTKAELKKAVAGGHWRAE